MDGDHLPDSDNIVRHVPSTAVDDDGDVTSAAFKLRHERGEDHISVSWMEYFGKQSFADNLESVKQELSGFRVLKPSQKLACLNVGNSCKYVRDETNPPIQLEIIHKPRSDDSHSGIFNIEKDEYTVAELLVETIFDTYPAK